MKRLRTFFESILFAGMGPGRRKSRRRHKRKWLSPLKGRAERILAGGTAPTDPLYLSNRSMNRKVWTWSLIGVPGFLLLAGIAFILSRLMSPPDVKPPKELSASEIAAKMLPSINKDFKLTTNHDVEVVEVAVDNTHGLKLVGTLRNTTDHEIAFAEVIVDLTNPSGSQLGAVAGTVENLPPKGTKSFQNPIKQSEATFAVVREVNFH